MQPQSSWNTPFVAIEETRKESQYKKFSLLSDLWNAPYSQNYSSTAEENWTQIFTHQNQTLTKAMGEATSVTSFYNQLQNAAWQYGKSLSEKDWPNAMISHPYDAYLAIAALKIGFLKNSECFLLERKTKTACTFYWLSSPIEHTDLCMLYHEIFRGYCYHLSRNLRVEVHSSILPSSIEKMKAWKINLLWVD